MIVCICHAISDRKISELKRQGVQTVEELRSVCHAGSDCGSCLNKLEEILTGSIGQNHSSPSNTLALTKS